LTGSQVLSAVPEIRLKRESLNEEEIQEPLRMELGSDVAGAGDRPCMDGERKTPARSAVAAGEGRSILPCEIWLFETADRRAA
jgi:hypothetical protein